MGRNRQRRNQRVWDNDPYDRRESFGDSQFNRMDMNKPYYQQNNQSYNSNNNNLRTRPIASSSSSGMSRMSSYLQGNLPGPSSSKTKTPEQIAFDEEFAKWEESFEGWRREFAHRCNEREFKEYERKFLNVRDKLLEKRKQIYSQNSFAYEFENQLSAADAMADSILSKFDEPVGYGGGNSNNSFNNRRNNMNNSSRSRSMSSNNMNFNRDDERAAANLLNLLQGLSQSGLFPPQQMMQGGNYGPRNMNMDYRRGGGRGMGRNDNDRDRRDMQRRNNNRDPIGSRKRNDGKKKSVNDRLKQNENTQQLPFVERIKEMYENAKKAELPKMLSGAANKRFKATKEKQQKEPEKLTADDKLFLEYVEYIQTKRQAYFLQKRQREQAKKEEGDETKNETTTTGDNENKDVDMSESTQEQEIEKTIDSMEVETTEKLDEDALLA